MLKVGIDAINFYTPHYYLDLKTLAATRGIDVEKFYTGLGQYKMAVAAPDEDIITMGANAAYSLVRESAAKITTLMFATESSVDHSKAGATSLHKLLNLPSRCRVIELKQACYAATAGLQMALSMLRADPKQKILLIASDIARYGLNTTGESSQGAAAVAMILSHEPRLLAIDAASGYYALDSYDFWRPNYLEEAIVDGRHSCDLYFRLLEETWRQYSDLSQRGFFDHASYCYHVSVPKLVEKAHKRLAKINGEILTPEQIKADLNDSLFYGQQIGNCYTAALYLAIISLLENNSKDFSGCRLGLYSYGSGCAAEFFSGEVQPNYLLQLDKEAHTKLLNERVELNYNEYEKFYNFKLPQDGSYFQLPKYVTGLFRLATVDQHKRIYEQIT